MSADVSFTGTASSGALAPPLDAFAQPVAVVDALGRVHDANAEFTALIGVGLESLRQEPRPLVHILPAGGPPVDLIDAAAGMVLPARGNGALTHVDGRVIDVAWSLGQWAAGGGDETLYVLTCTDVTEDKCLSCAIKASRDKYRQAFDDQTELVCRFEPDTRILFVNEAYAAAYGRQPREMIGRRLTDFMTAEDRAAFLAYLATFTPEDFLRDGEETFEVPGGGAVHQWWRRRAIFHRDGRLAAFQSVGRDLTESRRREQERARLERIVTASPVIGLRLRWARGLPVSYVSANVSRLGYCPDDLLDRRIPTVRLVHPADRRGLARSLRTAIRAGDAGLREVFRLRTRDGATLWAEAIVHPERAPNGAVTHLELVVTDVTEFMHSREKVRESERRLHDFATAANDWFWETDDALRFTWFSERARDQHGLDLGFVLGRRRWEIGTIAEDPEAWARHRAEMEARQPFRDFRFTVSLPDGKERRISVSGRPVYDGDSRFLGYRGSSTDVTHQERMSAALEESQRRYKTIFSLSEVALLSDDFTGLMQGLDALRSQGIEDLGAWLDEDPRRIADLIGRVVVEHANPAALALHGAADLDELVFLVRQGSRHADALTIYRDGLLQIWEGAEVVRFEGPRLRADGSMVQVFNAFRVPRTAEEARHVVVSMFDISDRVAAEAAMRAAMEEARFANRAKSEFLANMSHELRTPLNAIIGFSDVLVNEIFGPLGKPQYKDYAGGILDSGRHLLDLISDILDLSKIEAGNLRVATEVVDLAQTVEAAVMLVSARTDVARLDLSNHVAAGTTLTADPLRLKQILINLLSNAVKFTPSGGRVTVACRDVDGWRLVEVTDSGIGMSPEEQTVALSVFGQVQSTFSRHQHGTGLGLPICVKLMEAHGGTLEIDSVPGRGTCIRLRFPLSSGTT